MNIHLEYIWLDGNYPQRIRSKTKIVKDKISKEKGSYHHRSMMIYLKDILKIEDQHQMVIHMKL